MEPPFYAKPLFFSGGKGMLQNLSHCFHITDFQIFRDLFIHFLDIPFIFLWNQDFFDPCVFVFLCKICYNKNPIGRTLPLRVISPVIATSARTGTWITADKIAVAMVMPAEGPSFGTAPSGICT